MSRVCGFAVAALFFLTGFVQASEPVDLDAVNKIRDEGLRILDDISAFAKSKEFDRDEQFRIFNVLVKFDEELTTLSSLSLVKCRVGEGVLGEEIGNVIKLKNLRGE